MGARVKSNKQEGSHSRDLAVCRGEKGASHARISQPLYRHGLSLAFRRRSWPCILMSTISILREGEGRMVLVVSGGSAKPGLVYVFTLSHRQSWAECIAQFGHDMLENGFYHP